MNKKTKKESLVTKDDDKSWVQKLWKSQKQIDEDAKNYNNISWYLAPRYGAIALLAIQAFIGFITGLLGWGDLLAVVAVYVPLYYLIARGYRPFIVLAVIVYTADKFYNVYSGYTSLAELFWWFATAYMLVLSYRIEHAKAKLAKKEKTTYLRDALVALAILFGFSAAAIMFSYQRSSESDEIMYWKGFIYRNTDGVKAYCGDVNIDLNNYINSFNEQFKDEITFIDNKIVAIGLNPSTMFYDMNIQTGDLNRLVANHYDALHRILTSFLVIEQTGTNPEDFEWKEEYEQILSKPGFCSFIDLNPDLVQVIDSDFMDFPEKIKLLQAN